MMVLIFPRNKFVSGAVAFKVSEINSIQFFTPW